MPERLPSVLAYFITFSTYGSRLPGDARGTTDRRANVYGEPLRPSMRGVLASQRAALRWPAFQMADDERLITARAITRLCNARTWELHAFSVRTNHVHIVVEPASGTPEMMMQAFKAAATAALRKAARVDYDRKVWSRHGSTRYLFEEDAVPSAVRYVVERQGTNLIGAWHVAPIFK